MTFSCAFLEANINTISLKHFCANAFLALPLFITSTVHWLSEYANTLLSCRWFAQVLTAIKNSLILMPFCSHKLLGKQTLKNSGSAHPLHIFIEASVATFHLDNSSHLVSVTFHQKFSCIVSSNLHLSWTVCRAYIFHSLGIFPLLW